MQPENTDSPLMPDSIQSSPAISPTPYFLSRELDWEGALWLHGTTTGALKSILENGLLPRNKQKTKGNWAGNPSHKAMVYVTTAYAFHFALASETPGLVALLELDLANLPKNKFFADEDSYAQLKISDMPELDNKTMEERIDYWRGLIHDTKPQVGLQVLGNACYKGVVPPSAIKKVRLLTPNESMAITDQISDPVISPENFKILGGMGQRLHRWLMGYDTEFNSWFEQVCPLSIPLMSLAEAAAYSVEHSAGE